jgi:hypothetical protein
VVRGGEEWFAVGIEDETTQHARQKKAHLIRNCPEKDVSPPPANRDPSAGGIDVGCPKQPAGGVSRVNVVRHAPIHPPGLSNDRYVPLLLWPDSRLDPSRRISYRVAVAAGRGMGDGGGAKRYLEWGHCRPEPSP